MSYQVLARKWRPQLFTQMVGQEHVVKALTNALNHDQLHHAYLFSGTRGVGKTTLARIFAKSLNCEQGVSPTPCGVCSACREIEEGRFVDLLEVDAASRTKVDQTRELLENVPYAPVRGRYKVYLIDEVHMFSASSFNALLKTLEEPPPHVKFILATTDPQKMPVTVLSRCLQFNLKRLDREQIEQQMATILGEEHIPYDGEALILLSRGADGSMRDGLSLLDQAIAYGNGQVKGDEVRAMLGVIGNDPIYALAKALAGGDGEALLQQVDEMSREAFDFTRALGTLISLLHQVALAQIVTGLRLSEVYDEQTVRELAQQLSPEDVQLFYQIGLLAQKELYLAPDPRSGFEMVLLRMLAFRPVDAASQQNTAVQPPVSVPVQPRKEQVSTSKPTPVSEVESDDVDPSRWEEFIAGLQLGGITRQLASNCAFGSWDGETLMLKLDPKKQQINVGQAEARLRESIAKRLGKEIKLRIAVENLQDETPAQSQARRQQEQQRQAEEAFANDPLVTEMGEFFDARTVPGSVKPIKRH